MNLDYTKILSRLSDKGRYRFFAVIGILGIMLIMLSEAGTTVNTDKKADVMPLDVYRQQMEKEITSLLKEIDGVGDVKVMITLESGEENIYVQQQRTTSDLQNNQSSEDGQQNEKSTFENEIVVVAGQNGDEPLVEKTIQPVVQGVAVVCSGADDISVVSDVTNAVSVVFGIPTNRICVTKMR